MELKYFYGNEANRFAFYQFPKALFTDEHFRGIACDKSAGWISACSALEFPLGFVDKLFKETLKNYRTRTSTMPTIIRRRFCR